MSDQRFTGTGHYVATDDLIARSLAATSKARQGCASGASSRVNGFSR
jgi:hypothetical protein